MFKLKVTFPSFPGVESVYTSEIDDFSEVIALNSVSEKWGKPEHWVLHKDEPMAEAYDEADVLEEEMRDLDGVAQKFVKLKAEYSIEIIDLDQDPEYLLQQCHAKRQAEYPSLGEFADAFVKMQNGDSSQMEAYVTACMAVKAKYPKP
jgi:hypothetical protein